RENARLQVRRLSCTRRESGGPTRVVVRWSNPADSPANRSKLFRKELKEQTVACRPHAIWPGRGRAAYPCGKTTGWISAVQLPSYSARILISRIGNRQSFREAPTLRAFRS